MRLRAFLRWFVYTLKRPAPPTVYTDYVADRSSGVRQSSSLVLHDVLHADIPKVDSVEVFENVIASSLNEDWKVFASEYSDELSDILDAAFYARKDVLQFELGGDDVPGKSGDISPVIRDAIEGFNRKSGAESEFILVGGPPCQAYSNVGRSRRSKNDLKQYVCDETGYMFLIKSQETTLYKEYLRALRTKKIAFFRYGECSVNGFCSVYKCRGNKITCMEACHF